MDFTIEIKRPKSTVITFDDSSSPVQSKECSKRNPSQCHCHDLDIWVKEFVGYKSTDFGIYEGGFKSVVIFEAISHLRVDFCH